MLQALKGLDTFMANQDATVPFEASINSFLEKNTGSILHTLPESNELAQSLTAIVAKAGEI